MYPQIGNSMKYSIAKKLSNHSNAAIAEVAKLVDLRLFINIHSK